MPALQLFDIEDAQAVVRGLVTRSGLRLSYHEREDLEQYLLTTMWELSLRYDPSRGIGFGAWAVTTLKKRVVDHQRSKFRTTWKFRDRVYERPRPEFVDVDRLREALAALDSDPAADRDEDLGRLRRERDRCRARDLALFGLGAAERAQK